MRVTPITAEEANEQSVGDPWPPGEYDFVVHDASEETAKSSGNEQIKLILHVMNRDGHRRTVFDYLSSSPNAQWKVRHFCEAVGLVRQYETGSLDVRDIASRPGRCKLRIKPADSNYSAQNAVNDYIASAGGAPRSAPRPQYQTQRRAPQAATAPLDDDIPF